MLCLTLKTGESVTIGGQIAITVLDIKNGSVRVGITAPPVIPVHRQSPIPIPSHESHQSHIPHRD